jgi:regulator of protease activity HflC (stomatin/prohibitin superfamily)
MGMLILAIVVLLAAIAVATVIPKFGYNKHVSTALGSIAALFVLLGGWNYNDAGYCQHIRTIAGTESATCKTGWYFVGFGKSNAWPWAITIAHTDSTTAEGSEINPPYRVRMADNWTGDVKQTTRFEIPQDEDQFLNMVRKLRTPERLITSTLRPAVIASLDSVANLYTMEQYYAGGARDQFKNEYKDAIEKGRAVVRQITTDDRNRQPVVSKVTPSDSEFVADTSDIGDLSSRRVSMEKVLDSNGNEMRQRHDYMDYGIVVASAILESLDPDNKFEEQIQARKDAASRRIVAQEQRKEQEEQRLLAIQTGETNIAKRQAEARVEQIQKTTNAETAKKLALIEADRIKEEAAIQRDTAKIQLERAKIDAQSVQVAADAQAYEKRVILEADNALAQKLQAEIEIQKVWAQAFANRKVPQYVFGSGADGKTPTGSDNEVKQFMQLMSMDAAKRLSYDREVKK